MNMRRFFLTGALLTLCQLHAIEIKTPALTAEISPRGAVVTSLTAKGKRWLCNEGKHSSFTDRITRNIDPNTQGLAETAQIDFNLKEHTVNSAGTKITFSSCIGVMPGLRMEKSYFFSAKTPVIRLEYRFSNLGSSPIPLGLYTRSFFRSANGKSTYFHPGKKGIETILQGEISIPVKLPALAFLAVADETGAGFIQQLPADDTAGVLNWILKGGYTQEFLSAERPLLPGKTRVIKLECRYADNVAEALKKSTFKSQKLQGTLPVQVDRICGIRPKAKLNFFRSIPTPKESFTDCTFHRQFEDSWRAVEIPEGKENSPIAVYTLENGIMAKDNPLEFFRKGRNIIIKIPGFTPGRAISVDTCRLENDFVYNRSLRKWFGPMALKCRILWNTPGGKEIRVRDIPVSGALIRNGSMEESAANNPEVPAFMPHAAIKSLHSVIKKEDQRGNYLRVKKHLSFNFLPEHQKEYHLSLLARSVGGGGLTRIFIQFFDKDGKYLQKERKIVLATQNTFGWKKFESRFYVPSHVAFLRIHMLNGQKPGQYLDIDDLTLSLPVVKEKSVDRKTMLRDEMTKLWKIPLELLENISHELVTPHEKWFIPAEKKVEELLFISDVGNRITTGRRRDIVEIAQRLDMSYTHIPLIREIKNVVSAYSVYPTYFEPRVSEYTMECLKTLKKLPKTVCFTAVNFQNIKNKPFYELMIDWQKKGVNFIFYRCYNIPNSIRGKVLKADLDPVLPNMSPAPGNKPGHCQFYRNHKAVVAVLGRHVQKSSIIPDAQKYQATVGYATPYDFDFPWWEYEYLFDSHVLRYVAGIRNDVRLCNAPGGAVIKAAKKFKGKVTLTVENTKREHFLTKTLPVDLPQGGSMAIPADFELPGGTYVVKMQLRNERNAAVDAGAFRIDRKEITPLIITLKSKERIFPHPQKAEFTVEAPELPRGAKITVELFNQRREVLFRAAPSSSKKLTFSIALPHLRTFYNYIRAKVIQGDKILANVTEEFSVPGIPLPMNEFYGFTNPGSSAGAPLKDLAFDFAIAGDPRWKHTPLSIRRTRSMGLIPIPRRGDEKIFRPYRGDVKSDPVRTPCFTSPEFHAQLQKDTKFIAEHCKVRYNEINLLWAGDEMFLGRSVCTSPSCLAGFRARLEKSFKTIDALNSNWGTAFRSFAEVVPQQLEDLKDKDSLGPWLDHKMYMSAVFAENFFGKAKEELEKYVPNVKIGPTGTQVPGFGYNWHELMKYCRIVGYYSGIQTQVIHDLSDKTLMAGQCGGGYTHGHLDFEVYNYDTMWRSLINGGNLAYHYAGCAFRGDGAPTRNMKFFTASLRELKSGIGKLYLSGVPQHTAAILYSHPSLFAAMGSCGQAEWQNSQTSWAKLLDDLKISARFINYEELAEKGVPQGIKMVVLPFSIALSDREIASLERFVKAGGVVISDCDTGLFDEHGRKRSEKERLEKLKFLKSLGFSVARYSFVRLGGTGGELAASGSGDEKFIEECRGKVRALLKGSKIAPILTLKDAQGRDFSCLAKLRLDGPTRIYGFHQESDGLTPGVFRDSDGTKLTVTLPEAGHVYDVRNKKYLGKTSKWQMLLIPGKSVICGVVPEKFDSLKVQSPAKVTPGETFKVTASVKPAHGPQVFRLTITGTDGREIGCYSVNFRSESGTGTREIFIPLNAAKGKYKVTVTHILSNLSSAQEFEVR